MTSTSPATRTDVAPAPARDHAWREFRERRNASLAASHGVLAQVALNWVDPADASAAGTSEQSDRAGQTLPGIPGRWQILDGHLVVTWEDGELELLAAAPDVEVESAVSLEDGAGSARSSSAGSAPAGSTRRATVTGTGDVRLLRFGADVQVDVIPRGGRIGLRVLDPAAPRLQAFTAVPTFPEGPAFVVEGTFCARPAEVTVDTALPWLRQRPSSPGVVTVRIEGQAVELTLLGTSSLLFTDETSGTESADWRVVDVEIDGDRARIDFHRAVNFPCAWSTWATCPKPPPGNHVPVAIRAGERRVERTER